MDSRPHSPCARRILASYSRQFPRHPVLRMPGRRLYKEDYGIILTWIGKADPSISKEILKNGKEFPSLEAAYDAYLKALGDSKYDSVRPS